MRTSNRRLLGWPLAALLLGGCADRQVRHGRGGEGPRTHAVEGLASWYGPGFAGRKTANGEIYDPRDLTAAHKTLPFHSRVLVRNLDNGRTCWVRINDRGPFIDGRIVDLSYSAAQALGVVGPGTARVALDLRSPAAPADGARLAPATAAALPPVVTESELSPAPAAIAGSDLPPAALWSVQVGAFALAENAERLAQDLARRGLDSRVIVEGALLRVRVGSFPGEEQALQAALGLRHDGFEARVIAPPGPEVVADGAP